MNYKVLYRKYRPNNFDSLIGQKHIVTILKNSIKEEKLAHAYIFSGPRGTGKTSTARILAKAINCLNNQDGCACDTCENCNSFNTSPDIIEIDAASNNGVDEIRELINNVKIMPTSLKYKVYIIDEVHMLSTSAFNALLLTLEEPPEHVIFILATTNIESVPITILSRCQKFDFKRISNEDILERLKYICNEEKIEYDEDALKEISTLSDGGLRDALSILDQLSKNSDKITIDLISKEIGTISNEKINELLGCINNNDVNGVLKIFNEFKNINLNYKVVIKKLIDGITKCAIASLNGDSNCLDFDSCKNMVIELNDIMNKININVEPYDLIEMILLSNIKQDRIPEVKEKPVEEPIIETKQDIEIPKKVEKNEEITQNTCVTTNTDLINIRVNNCFVDASKTVLNNVKENWKQLINTTINTQIKGLIADVTPVASSNTYTILTTAISCLKEELNSNLDLIEKEYNNTFNDNKKIIFITIKEWEEEKNKYINNLKKGIKYQFKEEKASEQSIEIKDNNDIENIAKDIFREEIIEVK